MPSDSSISRVAQVSSAPVSTSVSGSERLSPRLNGFSIMIVVRKVSMSDQVIDKRSYSNSRSTRSNNDSVTPAGCQISSVVTTTSV